VDSEGRDPSADECDRRDIEIIYRNAERLNRSERTVTILFTRVSFLLAPSRRLR
jgi:hypothetical protein